MKVRLVFVPPGGGEAEYSLSFDLPSVPQPGDYISVSRPDQEGTEDFIVRRSWWYLSYPNNDLSSEVGKEAIGSVQDLVVECEFSLGPYPSEEHRRTAEGYRRHMGDAFTAFEASAY